ncbi:MAG: hypothetical protein ACI8PG_003502, partial [Planctomycetota bacterium]
MYILVESDSTKRSARRLLFAANAPSFLPPENQCDHAGAADSSKSATHSEYNLRSGYKTTPRAARGARASLDPRARRRYYRDSP